MVPFTVFWSKLRTIDKIAIALLVLVATAQIFLMATVTPDGDADNHVYRIALWRQMWQAHIYYPRWMPQAYFGFGAPTFYVYPPLVYIVSSILYLFDGKVSPTAMYRIVALIFCAGSLITACWYLRSRGIGTWPAVLGGLFYAYAPYRFLDTQIRGAFTEHAAFLFLPIVLWGVSRIILDGKRDRAALFCLAVGWAGVLTTHVPTSVVTFFGVAIFAPSNYRSLRKSDFWFLVLSLGFGTMLAAFFIVPQLRFGSALNWMTLKPIGYSFGGSYTPLLDIFSGTNLRINGLCVLTIVGAVMLLPAIGKHIESVPESKAYRRIIGAALVVQLPYISILFLKYFPSAVIVQFPWRFDMLILPIVALLWARQLDTRAGDDRSPWNASTVAVLWSGVLLAIVVGGLAGSGVNAHVHNEGSNWENVSTRWAPTPGRVMDSILKQYGSLPAAASQDLSSSESLVILNHSEDEDSLRAQFEHPHTIYFHRFYWPQWEARIDGESTGTMPDAIGRLTIRVPSGQHAITLVLARSVSEIAGYWISITALMGLIAFCVFRRP